MKLLILISFLITGLSKCCSQPKDQIVIINIEHIDRAEIAKVISAMNSLNPKVIAIDLQFDVSRGDEKDAKLVKALWECKNLVIPTLIQKLGDEVFISHANQAEFAPTLSKTGFINTLPELDEYKSLKRFIVYERDGMSNQRIEYHFSVSTAMAYDSLKAARFIKATPKIAYIDYEDGKRSFKKYLARDVLEMKLSKKDIEGKIIMIGFLGPGKEDKFFTPLNKMTRPHEPDMYGLEYLANIVAQVLETKLR